MSLHQDPSKLSLFGSGEFSVVAYYDPSNKPKTQPIRNQLAELPKSEVSNG